MFRNPFEVGALNQTDKIRIRDRGDGTIPLFAYVHQGGEEYWLWALLTLVDLPVVTIQKPAEVNDTYYFHPFVPAFQSESFFFFLGNEHCRVFNHQKKIKPNSPKIKLYGI